MVLINNNMAVKISWFFVREVHYNVGRK